MSTDSCESDLSRLGDLLDLSPLAMVVVDKNGSIRLANDLVTELLGWRREELTGRKFETLIPAGIRAEPDFSARRKDGSELPVDLVRKTSTWNGSAVVVVAILDLSYRRRTEKELRQSELRFRIAATHTADIIQEVDIQGDRMTYFGDIDRLWGYEPGEFPRSMSGLVEFIHPEDRDQFLSEAERVVESGEKSWSWQYRVRAADGTYRHVLDQGTITGFLDDGRANSGVGAFQDITEQLLKEQQLRDALADATRQSAEVGRLKDRLAEENLYLREELQRGLADSDIIGDCALWKQVQMQLQLVADTDSTVLLLGETGTGKGLLARALHSRSGRRNRVLIRVNCATLPATLIESELFGHEKGSFSGADRQRQGRFELADGGTLFLDEVGELPLELQAKLLHVLQTGEFERLGSSKTLRVDVRVIAATNRKLYEEVKTGRFRSDLYYRLAVFPIDVPPLRQRQDDIPLLAAYFLSRQNARHKKLIESIPEPAMAALLDYDWPGNVRELENLIERAVIVSVGRSLRLDTAVLRAGSASPNRNTQLPANPPGTLKDVERVHILAALKSCEWKVKGRGNAAECLGLKEGTLRARMKKLEIHRP